MNHTKAEEEIAWLSSHMGSLTVDELSEINDAHKSFIRTIESIRLVHEMKEKILEKHFESNGLSLKGIK